MVVSPRNNFKGYNFSTALYRRKNEIKALVAIIGGVNFYTGFDWKTFGLSFAAGSVALIVALLGDAIDYYFTEVEL